MQIKIEGSDECEVREGERELLAGSFFFFFGCSLQTFSLGGWAGWDETPQNKNEWRARTREGKPMKDRTRKGINRG